MIPYEFDTNDGKVAVRINKREARRRYNEGEPIVVCACNMRPFGPWHPEGIADANVNHEKDFDKYVMYYEAYNCTDSETGRYASFYRFV